MRGPAIAALEEYDRLKAEGEAPMIYIDRGELLVGTLKHGPLARITPGDEQ